jgi:penicillin-binding protein 1A
MDTEKSGHESLGDPHAADAAELREEDFSSTRAPAADSSAPTGNTVSPEPELQAQRFAAESEETRKLELPAEEIESHPLEDENSGEGEKAAAEQAEPLTRPTLRAWVWAAQRWAGTRALLARYTFRVLLAAAVVFGAVVGVLFVYQLDLPEVRALEDYRPNVVTELYSDDGQVVGSFALQRRILLTYEQIPAVLRDAVIATEDQHFADHWGIDLPRVLQAAWRNVKSGRVTEGASTLTMQLAGGLFLDRTDRSPRRKIQEALLALQIERHYTKEQIFTLYANQIYLGHGNYGFEAAAEFYFGKPVGKLTTPEAATIAAIVRGPGYSPLISVERAKARRDLVLRRMREEGKLTPQEAQQAMDAPVTLNVQTPRNDLAPYFVEEIRKHLERSYGTEAVHERGLRVYTTLDTRVQQAARQALRDGLHAYERRHGWRGGIENILRRGRELPADYSHDDWRRPIEKGAYLHALVTAVDDRSATLKVGPYRAALTPADLAWTGVRSPRALLKVGDLAYLRIVDITGSTVRAQLEQKPRVQGAVVVIDNATGEIKALAGGYSFEESKFNRATQALRQVGSSFKPFVYTTAIEDGYSPFDTVLDAPFTTLSGGETYSPRNYDEKYEGTITLRRALAGSRNIPAVKLAAQLGIERVAETARRFGITSALPPYLPLALGAAEISLIEQTSAFTVFPNEGIRIEPTLIRRVTTYDGALLEESRPKVHDVIKPEVARTMVAMLSEVVQFGTAARAKTLGRPAAGKTGTTNDFSDAWFVGFTPSTTAGVWIGFDDNSVKLGKKETGGRAALPVWIEVMKAAHEGRPPEDFPNVEPLSKLAASRAVRVDTPDTAPTEDAEDEPTAPRVPAALAAPAKLTPPPAKSPDAPSKVRAPGRPPL